MNDSADNERLLEDVLSEAVPADFREALLGETLRLARRRRRFRQTRRAVSAVAVLAALAALVWQSLPPRGVVPQKAGKSYVVVRTQPLPFDSWPPVVLDDVAEKSIIATMDLQKLMRADTPDQAKIDAQIDRVAQLRAQMQKYRTATLLEVRAMLKPERLKKWHEATMGDEEEAD